MARKNLYVVGAGPGDPELVTVKALKIVERCGTVMGSRRALETLSRLGILDASKKVVAVDREFRKALEKLADEHDEIVIASTGDPMYAGLGKVVLEIARDRADIIVVPGVSSLQLAAARIGLDWSNATLVDLHTHPDEKLVRYAFSEIVLGRTVVFTLHTRMRAIDIVERALRYGYTEIYVYVCENVGREDEKILAIDLARVTDEDLERLEKVSANAILFVVPRRRILKPLLGNDLVVPQTVPGPTKEEIRSVVATKSGAKPGDTVLEIGCGTGATTIELATRVFPDGKIVAVDRRLEAVEATKKNVSRCGVAHLVEVIHGEAPDVLRDRFSDEVFQAVVIDAGKRLRENIEFGYSRTVSGGKIVVVCVTIESFTTAVQTFRSIGVEPSITTISISRSRKLGSYTSLSPLNPVAIIVGDVR